VLQPVLRLFGTLPISPKHAKEAVRAAAESIAAGEIVCIFPEGELSRTGMLLRLRRGYELIARSAKCPVVPVWLDQLWGLHLFVRRREVFLQMAEENSVSGDRRFW
jgi:acyl-[acyl-carrier-protein]-phospholipid O-acyltransferase/long-chain-fatty-acid--[acyl-carrier-protein] ligase